MTTTGSSGRAQRPPGSRPKRRGKPAPDAPRRVAFDLLRAVDERGAYANLALPGLLRDRSLSGRDAAFATELGEFVSRVQGVVSLLQEILNVDGYQVLRYDRQGQQVHLDLEKLAQQFDITF